MEDSVSRCYSFRLSDGEEGGGRAIHHVWGREGQEGREGWEGWEGWEEWEGQGE